VYRNLWRYIPSSPSLPITNELDEFSQATFPKSERKFRQQKSHTEISPCGFLYFKKLKSALGKFNIELRAFSKKKQSTYNIQIKSHTLKKDALLFG
jgi:hypothetical protein